MNIRVIGAPSAWGTLELGATRTPGILRDAGLIDWLAAAGHNVDDGGDIDVPPQGAGDIPSPDLCAAAEDLVHAAQVATMAHNLRAAVSDALADDYLPLVIGGECSVSLGAIPALAQHDAPVTVAWLDAHADINTPATSASGLATGMPLATALGDGHSALLAVGADAPRPQGNATFLIGGRDIDAGEIGVMERFGLQHIDTTTARAVGPEEVTMKVLGVPEISVAPPEARAQFAAADPRIAAALEAAPSPAVYLHFDVDVIDPEYAPGVHYGVPGGFDPSEIATLVGYLCASGCVGAMSVASANLDHDDGRTVAALRDVFASMGDALAAL